MWEIITTTIWIVFGVLLALLMVIVGLFLSILIGLVCFAVIIGLIYRASGKRWPKWKWLNEDRYPKV